MSNVDQISILRDIWSAVQKDAELVKQNKAGEWVEERVRRALFNKPWLLEHYITNNGETFSADFADFRTEISWDEHVQRFNQSVPLLYNQAVDTLERAMSYRNFRVASTGLFFRKGYPKQDSWRTFSGMNTKHARNMRPVCSEPVAINGAYAKGYDHMIGIVVVGELREEDIGIIETLHPCQECRHFMNGHPATNNRSVIITAFPPESGGLMKNERHTLDELLKFHRQSSGDDF